MVIVKRLYTFMLQRFLPLLLMTFCICLFIVLMQFLWRYIEELVGKGLSIGVICELFFYAALTMVPTALPLAVLLASLMTFGNLGEKFELTAIKAAGISLIRVMKPLIIFMVFLAIGTFFFQNYALPVAQTKMWTLLFSMRQKSPEVEIPKRIFYDQIPGMNLYVERKDKETGELYDLIIYDITRGMDNSRVILAEKGKLNFTEDKKHLFLHLYNGEMFENINNNSLGSSNSNYLPFRRESFDDKQIYFVFDSNFNRMDESTMREQYIGKNVKELTQSIDSIQNICDSIGHQYSEDMKNRGYVGVSYYRSARNGVEYVMEKNPVLTSYEPLNLDTLMAEESPSMQRSIVLNAISKAKRQRQDYEFRSALLSEQNYVVRRHDIERQRRFTLPFACMIFFFIGAPLGAIIKKGGIGAPLVISVFLFILYFIFDNIGFKLAREGKTEVWLGIWLSSMVLLPLDVFFTWKAMGDSAVFNLDAYKGFFMRLMGKRMKRSLEMKEVVINEVEPDRARTQLWALLHTAEQLQELSKRNAVKRLLRPANYAEINNQIADIVEHLSNAQNRKAIHYLNEYPFSVRRKDLPDIIKYTKRLLKLIDVIEEEKKAEQETSNEKPS